MALDVACRTVEIRGARTDREVEAAYAFAGQVFEPAGGVPDDAVPRARRLDPIADQADVIIAAAGDDVVGMVRILNRAVWLGGTAVKVGGIAHVCVRADLRGRGYGRAVMEEALRRCRQRGDTVSILFARRAVDGFYPQFGYVGLGCHPELRVSGRVAAAQRDETVDLTRGIQRKLVPIYAAAYAHSYRGLVMSFVRDDTWWETAPIRLATADPPTFVTVRHHGDPVGYFVTHRGRVVEAANLPGAEDTLLDALLLEGRQRESACVMSLPLEHRAMRACRFMNHTITVRYAWDGGHMVRVLDPGLWGDAPEGLEGHEEARAALRRLVGGPDGAGGLASLPTWSILDEF